jgi:hypothetical protein
LLLRFRLRLLLRLLLHLLLLLLLLLLPLPLLFRIERSAAFFKVVPLGPAPLRQQLQNRGGQACLLDQQPYRGCAQHSSRSF